MKDEEMNERREREAKMRLLDDVPASIRQGLAEDKRRRLLDDVPLAIRRGAASSSTDTAAFVLDYDVVYDGEKVLEEGRAKNALDTCKELGVDGAALDKIWGACAAARSFIGHLCHARRV